MLRKMTGDQSKHCFTSHISNFVRLHRPLHRRHLTARRTRTFEIASSTDEKTHEFSNGSLCKLTNLAFDGIIVGCVSVASEVRVHKYLIPRFEASRPSKQWHLTGSRFHPSAYIGIVINDNHFHVTHTDLNVRLEFRSMALCLECSVVDVIDFAV